MSPIRMAATDDADRRPPRCAKRIKGALFKGLVTVGIITACCVAGMAIAAVTPVEFGGRWSSEVQKLTLDVSRCGDGWCGVEVTNGTTCGRTILRLDPGEQRDNESVKFIGRLQLAPESEAYAVQTILLRRGGMLALMIRGHTGGGFQFARRTFDFQAELVRTNDAVCQSNEKVS
jgi:hypothetical protein